MVSEVPKKNVLYLGGFYYEQDKLVNNQYGECENVVRCELEQIDNADIEKSGHGKYIQKKITLQ